MRMKRFIKSAAERLGYRIEGIKYTPRHLLDRERVRRLEFDDLVCRHMVEHGPRITFVQAGAFDGVSTDPLRKYLERYEWRGVMLEPQPGPAARLRELYRNDDRIVVLEAAIDGQRGTRNLYTIESDRVPRWAYGLASFDRMHLLNHRRLIPDIESMVRALPVECITFDDVLSRLPTAHLDLLQIDAEGADAYILSLFPFDRVKPAIVQWEGKNLTKPEKENAFDRLCSNGYLVAASGEENMVAALAQLPGNS